MIGSIGLINSPRVGNVNKLLPSTAILTLDGYGLSGNSFKALLMDYKRNKGNLSRSDQDRLIRAFCSLYPGECIAPGKSAQTGLSGRCKSCGGGRVR